MTAAFQYVLNSLMRLCTFIREVFGDQVLKTRLLQGLHHHGDLFRCRSLLLPDEQDGVGAKGIGGPLVFLGDLVQLELPDAQIPAKRGKVTFVDQSPSKVDQCFILDPTWWVG